MAGLLDCITALRRIGLRAPGHSVTVRPGDRFVMPRGFTGTWEVIEPTRKLYVMYEPPTA